jgi:hypothetical protein
VKIDSSAATTKAWLLIVSNRKWEQIIATTNSFAWLEEQQVTLQPANW